MVRTNLANGTKRVSFMTLSWVAAFEFDLPRTKFGDISFEMLTTSPGGHRLPFLKAREKISQDSPEWSGNV